MTTTFARSLDEALTALAESAAAGAKPVVVSGGTLCVPAMVRGELDAADVVDLGRTGLNTLAVGSVIELGALVSYQQVISSPRVRAELPLLHRMASGITGGIQIRNQGTLVGALCAARPQSDALAVLVALQAEAVVVSASGTRTAPVADLLVSPGTTHLAADELVAGLRIPACLHGTGYVKLKFAESSWPVVTAAAVQDRVVLGGVAGTPQVVPLPSRREVRAAVVDHLDALPTEHRWADLRAPWAYRRRVAPEIAARAVELAEEAR
ncbi:FAD binding domain-containing protein [Actinomycetospora termitidis]|uniref:FAD binding domain-containing protein n=1 Tax=Actinomycetospora termitidis TaxID=3053470 RepID=A0ABT7MLQ5_9PSEU|nr:FAD binding domain-containing protein [Actinomycetospora sp. Odt1-22]MDL5160513.1 FAD binding domain-containing protein [Actinomycetospora sp. Odt1-22]